MAVIRYALADTCRPQYQVRGDYMKITFLNCPADNEAIEETFASTVTPSERLPTPTRGWSPPRDVVIGTCLCVVMGLITFAVVQPARQKRMRTACMSNLRQIVLAMKQYTRDYDERFPLVFADNDRSRRFDNVSDLGWAEALYPYIKNYQVYQCPAEPNSADWRDGLRAGYCDFFYNARLAPFREFNIEFYSEVIVYGDHTPGSADNHLSPARGLDPVAATRHFEGANYAFVDGHVKWIKPSLISQTEASAGRYSLRFGRPRAPQPVSLPVQPR